MEEIKDINPEIENTNGIAVEEETVREVKREDKKVLVEEGNNRDTKSRIVRYFPVSNLSIDNATSIFVIIFLIVVMGWSAYSSMPKENFPEIKIPQFFVSTVYPGNSPLDMENLITRPLEKELGAISGVDEIVSTSIQDFSSIEVKFRMDIPADKAMIDVKDAIDKATLPTDLDREPMVKEFDPNLMPVLNINLSGFDDIDLLNEYAEFLQERIEKLPEIKQVDIRGVQKKEVSINVNSHAMSARQVSLYDIEQAIGRENMTISGGDLLEGGMRRNVRILGEFKNVNEIKDILIKNRGGNVYLKDIASVTYGYEETASYARTNKMPVVSLDVLKRTGSNLLDASDKIKAIIEDAEINTFPQNLEVRLINDTSKQTRMMVDSLENSIISGVILVTLVLLFFLGFRNALFVGVAIPLSMLMGFMMLGFMGVTMNMMVLFSLILALGMLVDNGIVVVENIYRLMEEGVPPKQAAKEGVGEVAMPIIASTATTLAAFLPLLFWNDIWGEFMKYLPITLILVLASSLFVGLVVNPVLCATFMKVEKEGEKTAHLKILIYFAIFAILSIAAYQAKITWLGSLMAIIAALILIQNYLFAPLTRLFNKYAMPALEKGYEKVLRFSLWSFMPLAFFGGTIALLMFVMSTIVGPLFERGTLLPDNEPLQVYVYAEFPIGTDVEKTNKLANELENRVLEILEPYDYMVEAVMANVGQGAGDPQRADSRNTPNRARISVFFEEFQLRRGVSTNKLMEEIREATSDFNDEITITLGKEANGPPQSPPINIEITGDGDFEELIDEAQKVKTFLDESGVVGYEDLKLDVDLDKPELLVKLDRAQVREFGLSTAQVAGDIRTAIFGKEVSKFKQGEDEYPIMLRFNQEQRYDPETVLNQQISFMNQNMGRYMQIPVSTIATTELSSTLGSVRRKDQERMVTLYSNLLEGYNGGELVNELKSVMDNYEVPDGYTIKFTGQEEENASVANFLMNAMLIAVFLIFLIIVMQFNSIAMPFLIVLTVVFSTIGVFLGYFFAQMDVVILMTGIGIISLAGVVVNNAIVLIDYTNLVRKRQREELNLPDDVRQTKAQVVDAIVRGGSTRLRPVLLTAITTILGLIPMAIGLNIDFFGLLNNFDPNIYMGGDTVAFWGAMAWTVIFGLTFATFLTLIMVPVMYLLIDRFQFALFGKGVNR